MATHSTHIWLRSETKPAEERTALTPKHARELVDAGFRLTVEKSSQSAFTWNEYESTGCEIAEEFSWEISAPDEAIILGLKELETSDEPLRHRHIHFAHVYKEQTGWKEVLKRFGNGGGCLYDLEFLIDDRGRRIAAFGHWAGFAGAGLAMLALCNHNKSLSPVLDKVQSRPDSETLVAEVRSGVQELGRKPTALVIGALGRCGKGAIELLESVGVDVVKWDLEETKPGGPFQQIANCDVFLNCVFIEKQIPPFVNMDLLQNENRTLSVICDVSCDPYGTYNPVPIYDRCTTFDDPTITILSESNPLHLIAIDHLPSLLPRESSEDFCEQLMPHLLQLGDLNQGVWKRANELFNSKTAMI